MTAAEELPESRPRRSFAREATAAVGIPILVGTIGWAPLPVFASLLVAAVLVATIELVLFSGRDRLIVRLAPPLAAELLLLGAVGAGDEILLATIPWIACGAGIVFPLVWMWSRSPLESAIGAVSAQLAALFLVGAPGAAILRLFLEPQGGRRWIALLLIASWSGDTAAYYVGRRFGRHRFAPQVSPKKTWEGSLGGAIATIVTTTLCVRGLFSTGSVAFLIAVGFVLALAGQMGDLSESLLKRSSRVKDSGGILPGHGGILDRIDALLWTGPIVLAVALHAARHGGLP